MTDEVNTQTAAQTTEVAAQPAAEVAGAQPVQTAADLDSILNEFKTATETPAPAPELKPAAVAPDVVREVQELKTKLAEREFQEAIAPVVGRVRGEIPKEVYSDEEIQDWMDGRAKRDPRLQQAWLARANNPGAWAKVEKALSQDLAKKFSKLPDPDATEDRAAVTAAVRGASQKAPAETPPNYGNMTDAEFAKAKASLGL